MKSIARKALATKSDGRLQQDKADTNSIKTADTFDSSSLHLYPSQNNEFASSYSSPYASSVSDSSSGSMKDHIESAKDIEVQSEINAKKSNSLVGGTVVDIEETLCQKELKSPPVSIDAKLKHVDADDAQAVTKLRSELTKKAPMAPVSQEEKDAVIKRAATRPALIGYKAKKDNLCDHQLSKKGAAIKGTSDGCNSNAARHPVGFGTNLNQHQKSQIDQDAAIKTAAKLSRGPILIASRPKTVSTSLSAVGNSSLCQQTSQDKQDAAIKAAAKLGRGPVFITSRPKTSTTRASTDDSSSSFTQKRSQECHDVATKYDDKISVVEKEYPNNSKVAAKNCSSNSSIPREDKSQHELDYEAKRSAKLQLGPSLIVQKQRPSKSALGVSRCGNNNKEQQDVASKKAAALSSGPTFMIQKRSLGSVIDRSTGTSSLCNASQEQKDAEIKQAAKLSRSPSLSIQQSGKNNDVISTGSLISQVEQDAAIKRAAKFKGPSLIVRQSQGSDAAKMPNRANQAERDIIAKKEARYSGPSFVVQRQGMNTNVSTMTSLSKGTSVSGQKSPFRTSITEESSKSKTSQHSANQEEQDAAIKKAAKLSKPSLISHRSCTSKSFDEDEDTMIKRKALLNRGQSIQIQRNDQEELDAASKRAAKAVGPSFIAHDKVIGTNNQEEDSSIKRRALLSRGQSLEVRRPSPGSTAFVTKCCGSSQEEEDIAAKRAALSSTGPSMIGTGIGIVEDANMTGFQRSTSQEDIDMMQKRAVRLCLMEDGANGQHNVNSTVPTHDSAYPSRFSYDTSSSFQITEPLARAASDSNQKLSLAFQDHVNDYENIAYGEAELDQVVDVEQGGNETEFEEAQAGIPLMLPGAFAIRGIEAGVEEAGGDFDNNCNSSENGSSCTEIMENGETDSSTINQTIQNSSIEFPSTSFQELDAPFDAEIIDEGVLVDGLILFDDEDPEYRAKIKRRVRRIQLSVICFAIAAVVAVTVAAVDQRNRIMALRGSGPPTLVGWKQVGIDLIGPSDDDNGLYGYSVSMSGDGERLAIGSPGRDAGSNELLVGAVEILDWNGTDWIQYGQIILGPDASSEAGTSVVLSKDGRRVAVGSPSYESQQGQVAVYEDTTEDGGDPRWSLVGDVIEGDVGDDGRFGLSIALSSDGSILAVGAPASDSTVGKDSGIVRVYQWNATSTNSWVKVGDDIPGQGPEDYFGWSLALTGDGYGLASGAVGSHGSGRGDLAGSIRSFEYNGTSWAPKGPIINNDVAFESFGVSIALSEDGNVMASGAIGHSTLDQGVDVGMVLVFEYKEEENTWTQLGQTLIGQGAFDSFGYSVALSSSGSVLAASGPRNDEYGEDSGHIQIFELTNNTDTSATIWNPVGGRIGGSYEGGDLFGWSVSLSSDGGRIAGGAPFTTFDGRINDVGTVRIYDSDTRNSTNKWL